jgi:hypothetical protein
VTTYQVTLQQRQEQERRLFEEAKTLLFPHVWSREKREGLLSDAFYPGNLHLLEQIDIDGRLVDFLPRCWQTLHQAAADGSFNEQLLTTLKPRYGLAEQEQIERIILEWRQLCAASLGSPFAARHLPERDSTAPPGAPPLFFSYADADAGWARRLQADLAAYGYVTLIERPPLDKEDERLTAIADGLGGAHALLFLVGARTATDRWQRLEYLAALERRKPVILFRLDHDAPLPDYLRPVDKLALVTANDGLDSLLRSLPPQPPPGAYAWLEQAETLRPRLAELLYMDRLKLAELLHTAQYTHLSGQAEIRRSPGGRLRLNPVVARQEYHYHPWRQEAEMAVEQRQFSDAVAELKAIGRAALLGDPGSGKTTTLYKLADDLIETALADPAAPIPLMIRLGLWTPADEPFLTFLRRSAGELGTDLERRLADGRIALLLDGINEIPANQHAVKYRQVGDFLARHPRLMAWVSCREQDYPPERDLRLDRVKVTPLDPVRIGEFIHNYLDGRPDFGSAAADDLFWQLAGAETQATHRRFMAELEAKLAEPERTFWLANQLSNGMEWGMVFV